jgi:hypothetical protein
MYSYNWQSYVNAIVKAKLYPLFSQFNPKYFQEQQLKSIHVFLCEPLITNKWRGQRRAWNSMTAELTSSNRSDTEIYTSNLMRLNSANSTVQIKRLK